MNQRVMPVLGAAKNGEGKRFNNAPTAARVLQFLNKVTDTNIESIGDFQQRRQRSLHVATLQFPNEVMVQICLLGKLLLGESRELSIMTYFVTQFSAMVKFRRHSTLTRTRSVAALHTV